jgi:phosphatidylglycerol:prolipoprotein diacylglycerol transferase
VLVFIYQYLKANASKYNLNFGQIEPGFFLILISALFGARIYHVLSSWSYYQTNLGEIFNFWQGGLGIFGALLGGFLAIFCYCKAKNINLKTVLDLVAPPILVTQAIGRLGNFFNLEGYGSLTNLPWKIYIPSFGSAHPTFFYESLLCLFAFLFYRLLTHQRTNRLPSGFAYYLVSYGFIRLITESFRIDTFQIHGLKIAFVISILMIFSGIYLFKNDHTRKV